MDAAAAARFTALRQAHFPANRNWLTAHITLFHALPVTSIANVLADVADVAGTTDVFGMRIDRVLFLGGGVAYAISSPQGLKLRRTLADGWGPLLGRQDRAWQGRLHITVQNKVEPATARALHTRLERDFMPEEIRATGLEVWYYTGGPWQTAGTFSFTRQGLDGSTLVGVPG